MANCTALRMTQRTGNGTLVDNLSYTYTGNQLTALQESVRTSLSEDIYQPGATPNGTYEYDANGNMKKDSRKSLTFNYNALNLLNVVKENNAVKANYRYLANGTKTSVRNGNGNTGYDYDGSFVYTVTNNTPTLEAAHFTDGQLKATGVNYILTDHLGSVRALVDANGTLLEQNDYYPFGSKHVNASYASSDNRYTFSGKESQDLLDLNTYDFGARMYDGNLGLWKMRDALSECDYASTPYNYCGENPIRYIDPNGEMKVIYNPDGTYKETQSNNWFHNTFFGLKIYIDYGNGNLVQLSNEEFWLWQRTGKYDMIGTVEEGSAIFWELYINEPAEDWLDAGDKFIASSLYSLVNSPEVLLTGRTLSGAYTTPDERMSCFIDVAVACYGKVATSTFKMVNPKSWFKFKRSNMHIPVKEKKASYDAVKRVYEEESKHLGVHENFFSQINRLNELKDRYLEIEK